MKSLPFAPYKPPPKPPIKINRAKPEARKHAARIVRAAALTLTPEEAKSIRDKPKGLGDRVEKIAQPIAKVIDRVAGTRIQECGGCKKRKAWLNKHFPAPPNATESQ